MLSHALVVTTRACAATLAAALVTHVIAPAVAPLITVVIGTTVLAFELTRVAATLGRRLEEVAADIAQVQPLLALPSVLPTRRPLPELRGYAIAPDFAVMLAQLVADKKPELVVETGSGVSTVIIAYALEKLGRGRVIALEHDPTYARRTRDELERHGLTQYATVVDAPLEPVWIDGREYRWYSPSAISDLDNIDLVVDDGPPRHVGPMLRYASLPLLSQHMREDGIFVLDVVGDEERQILARWRAELPDLHHEHLPTKKGNVLIRRASA